MTCKILAAATISFVGLATAANAAGPAPAQFYKAKLSGGGTFVEETNWDSPASQGPTIYKGNGKLTVHLSASQDIQLVVTDGIVSAFGPPGHGISSAITANYAANGSMTDSSGSDSGSYTFGGAGGPSAQGGITIIDDFSPNGEGLGFSLFAQGQMTGECKDAKYGNNCALNPAGQGDPEFFGGGTPPNGTHMSMAAGGGFVAANSSRPADTNPLSTNWRGLACSGSLSTGWTCGFSGSRVYKKGPGYTFTARVQMNAKISIVGNGKW
jgi:hypothetical protein